MLIVCRLLASLALLLAGITLIRPRSGWGRLGLFIPKLFTGSMILPIGLLGLTAGVWGWWAYKDAVTVLLGAAAAILAVRHIARLVLRAKRAVRTLGTNHSGFARVPAHTMLPYPWVGVWKITGESRPQRDVRLWEGLSGNFILADIWRPPGAVRPSGLGIVYLHGSGWHYADKDFGTRPFFGHLSGQGHVVLDLAYSLAPAADLFTMMAEVKRAIVWMKTEGMSMDVDPTRVVLMGGSAGGQLALLAAYTPNDPRFDPPEFGQDTSVCAVVSYYGPPDLRVQYDRFLELPDLSGDSRFERAFMKFLEARFEFDIVPVHRLLPSFLGGTPAEIPELYALGSPDAHIGPDCPPTLLLQGEHDFSGMAPEVDRLHQALISAGCRSVLYSLPDTDHGFDLYRPAWSPAAQAATFVTERFLANLT
ncbi:MAG: alpha/beta fold hydrolase [Anaerolineales bacterium]